MVKKQRGKIIQTTTHLRRTCCKELVHCIETFTVWIHICSGTVELNWIEMKAVVRQKSTRKEEKKRKKIPQNHMNTRTQSNAISVVEQWRCKSFSCSLNKSKKKRKLNHNYYGNSLKFIGRCIAIHSSQFMHNANIHSNSATATATAPTTNTKTAICRCAIHISFHRKDLTPAVQKIQS